MVWSTRSAGTTCIAEGTSVTGPWPENARIRSRIRTAINADVPAITEIYNQAIALGNATADTSPVTVESRRDWLARHPPETHPVYIAEYDGKLAGWCSISPYRPGRMALRHTAEISYYVHEDYRGKGAGSALVEHAIGACSAIGLKTLFAILLDNNPRSVALLKKLGFQQWGHMPDVADFSGTEVGHLYYGLRLPAPNKT
ncbi:MAG: N-acetyltransferase family protein [Gammaproteobacteria bacterium]|jgi:phosphinothricin acetyltransferase|nr:N-acetyltransferase family protein [Gammaproteobacteria bacterium]MDP7270323.1 N-acetyltransferase family protein [Gammaproteobacteria bacterium]